MQNIFILYMPPNNAEAMVHYEETIRQRVEPERIFRHIEPELQRNLKSTFGNGRVPVWGSRSGPQNDARFAKMKPGDEILIVEGPEVKLLGRVANKTRNAALARELWRNLAPGSNTPWELVYFIANPREIGVPLADVQRLLGYEPFQLHGFTCVSDEKLRAFFSRFGDLYSVLVAIREGHTPREVADPELAWGENRRGEETEVPDSADAQQDSDHLRIQWTLLRLGRQAGQKVWAPRGDQKRISSTYHFDDFEETFAGGLDTQVRYVENIDVVWKEQFRIDAAFEVENSTSIYSGLLRFADLTMVAPNTMYPLFLVAPDERRNRVREQLTRPTFKHLKIAERVRFLPYSKVDAISEFFGDGKGVTVEVFSDRAEKLS
jgi:hypothetical protein